MNIELVTFCSSMHQQKKALEYRSPLFSALRRLGSLKITSSDDYSPNEFPDEDDETIFFIASGGTESKFMNFMDRLPLPPIILLCDGYFNSLAAGLEIATWLQQQGIDHDLLNVPMEFHDLDFLQIRLSCIQVKGLLSGFSYSMPESTFIEPSSDFLYHNDCVRKALADSVIGLIGGEAKWLIASHIDKAYLEETYKCKFVDIPIEEVLDGYNSYSQDVEVPEHLRKGPSDENEIKDAIKMSAVLEDICIKYSLSAMTLNCFGLIKKTGTTACLAMSILDSKGYITGCEGDIPLIWSQIIAKAIYGKSSFIGNPCASSKDDCTIDFAHCTASFSLVSNFTLPTHFESGMGIAIAGTMKQGRYVMMKIGGKKMEKIFRAHGILVCNTSIPQRCRTKIRFKFDDPQDYEDYFKCRLGNHIILVPQF